MGFCLNLIERLRLRRLFRLIPPTDFTAGSVIFSGSAGVFSQDNANLFYDDTNNRLGVGTNNPTLAKVTITCANESTAGLGFENVAGNKSWQVGVYDDDSFRIIETGVSAQVFTIAAGGNVGINTTTPTNFGAGYRCLQLDGSSGGVFRSNANSGVAVGDFFADASGGGAVIVRAQTNTPLIISVNNAEVARFGTGGEFQQTTKTVAQLPAAGVAGRRLFVTDATTTTFASIVAGGGANKVPVYDDGTNWRIG